MEKLILVKKNDMFEEWYNSIEDYTPKSIVLPLSLDEQLVLREITYDSFIKRGYYSDGLGERSNKFTKEQEMRIIDGLKIRVDEILKSKKMFFRLNIFSPKDVGSCIVNSADEVIDLITQSERIYFKSPTLLDGKSISFVFREVIEIDKEYRAFVRDGAIIGISQYEDSDVIKKNVPVTNLYGINEHVFKDIYTWLDRVIVNANIGTSVVDIALLKDGTYCIVELNPFNNVTDKCLLYEYDMYGSPGITYIVAFVTSKMEIKIIEYTSDMGRFIAVRERIVEIKETEKIDILSAISFLKNKIR